MFYERVMVSLINGVLRCFSIPLFSSPGYYLVALNLSDEQRFLPNHRIKYEEQNTFLRSVPVEIIKILIIFLSTVEIRAG